MNNVVDVTLSGEAANSSFGHSVSTAGDVNGDGYADVIVGAFGYKRAYIYFGGLSMNNAADVTMQEEWPSSNVVFGFSVSSAGDVNGDGYSDVIVGDKGYSSDKGRAYIYFGGSSMNNAPDDSIIGEASGDLFGASVSSGDINGDGYADVIAGAYGYSTNTGRAYMFFGSVISVKPILLYVKDVPIDQGGLVDLKWARSSYDVIGQNVITNYIVQRSAPPVGGNFAWVNVASITATKESFYYYLASTPYDSSANSSGTFFFRITASTNDVNQFWRSAIFSGHSIDNIAPLMISPFTAAPVLGNVVLNWKRSDAPDLLNYILYRSTSPTIDPNIEPVFSTTSDSTYFDTSPLSGLFYYFIVAQDIHNNKSPVAVAVFSNMTLNLDMFIEGFYNEGSNLQVSDSVTVELRNADSPFAVADVSKVVVSSAGTATFKFGNAANGNYYLAIKHRNSVETWSKFPVALSRTVPVNYNFTSSALQAFGNNQKQIDSSPVRYGIYGGDVNQSGSVDLTDIAAVYNGSVNFLTGYVVTDVTGDNVVDLTDITLVYNNSANFVARVIP